MNPFLSPSLLSLQLAALRRKKALFLRLIDWFIGWCTGMQVPKRVSCAIPVSVEAIVASKFKLVWWRQLGGNLETFKKLPHDSYSGGNQFPPVRKRFIVIHTGCGNGFLQFPRLPPVSTKYELGFSPTERRHGYLGDLSHIYQWVRGKRYNEWAW